MKKHLLFIFASFFTISLFAQPVITQNPQDLTVCIGECEDVQITAVGNSLTYQWQSMDSMGWVNLGAAGNVNYTFCADTIIDSLVVRCIVEDDMGMMDTSGAATLRSDACLPPIADFEFEFWGDSVCFENTSQNATSVLWNFGNGGQSTEFSPCYDYMAYEAFKARLYVYNDYGSDMIEKDIDLTSVNEIEASFDVFPNPTNGVLNISSYSLVQSIQVVGLQGDIVFNLELNKANITLDLSELDKGVYIIQIVENDKAFHQKIVIQ